VKAGSEYRIECREHYDVTRPGSIMERDRIGDVNITVTLTNVKDSAGKELGITDPTDPNVAMLTWEMFDVDGESLTTGTEHDKGACLHAMELYGEKHKITTWTWKIFDEAGNLRDTGTHRPPADEFPWVWVAVAIAVIAVVAVILLVYMRSGHAQAVAGPAAAPVPAVVVVPQAVS
jgi:hypothetical protein